ncbi:DUF5606 family protein [Agriterribacter humi]|uniref:DUF5606 family protein n=1 Tax=Agriterribacter humi TaxID=1104781 RepID=UPI001264A050|nr:DUF5606 domain-containing protein [Agriterribacter humi]
MEYSKIISVTGLGGLFELLSSKADGAIVRSLEDKSTRFVSSRVHNFSHLESIEIFTVRDNVNLADVFLAMQKDTTPLPSEKDNAAVKKYFEAVYPDMDFERVYTSDMKKMVKWLGILTANNIEIKAPQPEEEEETVDSEDKQEAEAVKDAEAAPQKAAPKKTEKKKEEAAEEEKEAKSAPKKKAAPKKAEASEEEPAPKKKAAPKKKTKE